MDEQSKTLSNASVVGLVAVILFAVSFFWGLWVIVPSGHRGVVTNFGAVQDRIMGEGLHFKVPYLQSVKKVDVTIQKEQIDATAASKDLQNVTAKVALNYHLDPERVNKIWQTVRDEYTYRIIDPALQESVKAVTARYTAEELITKRELVREEIRNVLKEKLQTHFLAVDEFNIVDFKFSRTFDEAIEAKVTAEQNALAAKNKLEQVKYEAEQRITSARGEAEAIRIQAQAITQQGGREYVNLKWVEKWNGTLPQTVLGDSVPLINLNQ